jgi:hypothetical protein
VYEVRGRPLLRFLLGPFDGALLPVLSVAALVLLLVGGWVSVGAACFLLLVALRSYMASCTADSTGVVVTNRFVRHRIPWAEVRGIWVPRQQYHLVPTLQIERRGSLWFSISAYATLGMGRDRLRAISLDLVALAAQNGYSVVGGSPEEVDAKLREAVHDRGSVSEQNQDSADPRPAPVRALRSFALALLVGAIVFALVAFEADGAAVRLIAIVGGVSCLAGTARVFWRVRRLEGSRRPLR